VPQVAQALHGAPLYRPNNELYVRVHAGSGPHIAKRFDFALIDEKGSTPQIAPRNALCTHVVIHNRPRLHQNRLMASLVGKPMAHIHVIVVVRMEAADRVKSLPTR
jgi:hypothetical protein